MSQSNKARILRAKKVLESSTSTPEQHDALNLISDAAINGVKIKAWINRFVFGFSLPDAAERWIEAFHRSYSETGELIPAEESKGLVAAWMRFVMLRGLILLLASSLLPIITSVALYFQIKRQDELIQQQKLQFASQSRVQSTQYLYAPTEPAAVRSYALQELAELNSVWPNCKQSDIRLARANLQAVSIVGACLEAADLSGATWDEMIIENADLRNTKIRNAWGKALLKNVNLEGADLDRTAVDYHSGSEDFILASCDSSNALLPVDFDGDLDFVKYRSLTRNSATHVNLACDTNYNAAVSRAVLNLHEDLQDQKYLSSNRSRQRPPSVVRECADMTDIGGQVYEVSKLDLQSAAIQDDHLVSRLRNFVNQNEDRRPRRPNRDQEIADSWIRIGRSGAITITDKDLPFTIVSLSGGDHVKTRTAIFWSVGSSEAVSVESPNCIVPSSELVTFEN